MTISTDGNRISYDGNSVTVAFSFPYKFTADSDLQVYVIPASGVSLSQTLTTDYTVTGAGTDDDGEVTMVTAPATGETLLIIREQPYTQPADLPENDPLPSATIEEQLDRQTIMAQQLLDLIGRSLSLANDDVSGASVMIPALVASKILQVKSDASGFQFANAADLSLSTVSAYIDTLLDDPDEATARGTLGLGGKHNLTATADPAVSDDSDDGYGINSLWANVTAGRVFICLDATVGAAVWVEIGNPLTTAGDLVYRDADRLARLAVGSEGDRLAVVSGVPAYVSGDWEILETLDADADTYVTFTADFSAYRRLWIDIDDVKLAGTSGFLAMQISQASTWRTASYENHIDISSSASTAYAGGVTPTTSWPVSGSSLSTDSSHRMGADVFVHRPNEAIYPLARWVGSYYSPSGDVRNGSGSGGYGTAGAIDGIRFTNGVAAAITQGRFILKGIR